MENIRQPRDSWSFLQNNNHQTVKKMEWTENRKYEKIDKEPLGFRFCVVVSLWVYVGVCVCVYVL